MDVARSLMFVPGHRARMVEKALGLAELDVAILDLEDGVPAAEKAAARGILAGVLGASGLSRPARFVRVNAIATDETERDLAAVVRPGLAGIVLPKVDRPDDLRRADALLGQAERAAGLRPGSIPLVPCVESALGLVNAYAIAAASPRVAGVMFGAEDYANDLGLPASREGEARELLYPRAAIAVAAAAARVLAFDGIWPDIADAVGLRRDSEQGRRLGYSGKTLVHPGQIAVVNEVFAPSEAEIERARAVVDAFEAAERGGAGAVAMEGQLVDRPIVERARRIARAGADAGSGR